MSQKLLVTELHQQLQMFYSAAKKICPLKTLKQHQCGGGGDKVSSRLGFWKRVAKTKILKVPEGARKEAGLQHHFRIAKIIEKHNIPKFLVLNSDQTASKYVTVGRTTMAPKNSSRVDLAGRTDKRSITLTLTVTLYGKILPFQIINGGKTDQSLTKITFPAKLSTSANEKHHSNTEEVIKHLQEIVIPYVNEERKERKC